MTCTIASMGVDKFIIIYQSADNLELSVETIAEMVLSSCLNPSKSMAMTFP